MIWLVMINPGGEGDCTSEEYNNYKLLLLSRIEKNNLGRDLRGHYEYRSPS